VGVAGGEARVELKGFKPHPWVPLVREEVAGGGGSATSGGCWSSEHGGGVCRGGAVLEWWGDGEGELVGVDMGGGGVPRRWSGEKAKGRMD